VPLSHLPCWTNCFWPPSLLLLIKTTPARGIIKNLVVISSLVSDPLPLIEPASSSSAISRRSLLLGMSYLYWCLHVSFGWIPIQISSCHVKNMFSSKYIGINGSCSSGIPSGFACSKSGIIFPYCMAFTSSWNGHKVKWIRMFVHRGVFVVFVVVQ